jgi:hypothetical protein
MKRDAWKEETKGGRIQAFDGMEGGRKGARTLQKREGSDNSIGKGGYDTGIG